MFNMMYEWPKLVNCFQAAMVQYGVDKADIFQTNDLFERKDLGAVTNTIFALDRAVNHLQLYYNKSIEKV